MSRIALCGKMGAGKSHVAELLEGLGYRRLHFASPLKRAAAELDPNPSRELLQALSEVTRRVEPHPLVEQMRRLLESITADRIVVDDLRFPDELLMLREAGFAVLMIDAPLEVRLERLRANGRLEDESQLYHASEVALDDYSLPVVVNDVVSDDELVRAVLS